jgi:hypothetical protein
VRWYTSLRYLVGVVISVVVILYLPKVAPYPLRDRFLGFGLAMGIVISIIRAFDKSAQLAMRDEFASYMKVQMPLARVAGPEQETRMEELSDDEDPAISRQVWNNCWKHIIFYGAAAVVIIWVGRFVRWLGLLLFGGLAIITVFDILKLFIVRAPGTLRTVLTRRSRETLRTDTYRGTIAVAFVESMILVQYTFYLYGYFFK